MENTKNIEHKDLLIKYYKNLINSIFKLIPIINGEKYKSREVIYSQEEAFKNYQIYLGNLLVEIHGNCELFFQSDNSIKLASILTGMIQQIQAGENQKVKRLTMESINLCKKIIKEIELKEE